MKTVLGGSLLYVLGLAASLLVMVAGYLLLASVGFSLFVFGAAGVVICLLLGGLFRRRR